MLGNDPVPRTVLSFNLGLPWMRRLHAWSPLALLGGGAVEQAPGGMPGSQSRLHNGGDTFLIQWRPDMGPEVALPASCWAAV